MISFDFGDLVEATWKGRSTTNSDDTYVLQFADGGDRELNQLKREIRLLSKSPFFKGEEFEANWKGGVTWYPGKILSRNSDGSFHVEFADGTIESTASRLRPKVEPRFSP